MCSTDLLFRHVVVQEIQKFSKKWVVLREINTLSFEAIALGHEIFRASIVICPVLHTHNNCLEIRTVFRTRVHYYTLTFVHIGSLIRMHFFKGNPILCSSSIVKVLHAWMQMVKMFTLGTISSSFSSIHYCLNLPNKIFPWKDDVRCPHHHRNMVSVEQINHWPPKKKSSSWQHLLKIDRFWKCQSGVYI